MKLGDILGGRFELGQRAGAGGMGEVFRARDRVTGDAVAVKVMLGGKAAQSARFAREVEVLSELESPGIVRYVAHGAGPEGEPFLAMEWLEGEDLSQRLCRGPLSVSEAVKLGTRVAEALSPAHARGVVHRDLKPSNLFLVEGDVDRVKVLDFGIAWQAALTRMTRTGALVGTPGYMAPEQARGQAEVDARADVFSLGCVLFECLTGKAAFSASQLLAVLAKVLLDEVPRLGELPSLMELGETLHSVEPEPEGAASFVSALATLSLHLLMKNQFELGERCALRMISFGGPLTAQDPGIRAWVEFACAVRAQLQSDAWAALTHCRRAEVSFVEAGDNRCMSMALAFQGSCLILLGAYAEGQELLEELLESGEAPPVVLVDARLFIAMAKAERGAHDEALGEVSELAAFASAARDLGGKTHPLLWVAKSQLRKGDLEAAERAVMTAIDAFSSRPRDRALALTILTEIQLAQRRSAEALASIEQAIAALQSIPPAYRAGAYLPLLHAEALDATGDHEGAREVIERARTELFARADQIDDPAYRRSFLENVSENARTLARARQWLGEEELSS